MRMEMKVAGDWNAFTEAIAGLRREYGSHCESWDGKAIEKPIRLLFRGQPDAAKPLTTTLERASKRDWHVVKYLSCVGHYAAEIESFTGQRWNLPDLPEIKNIISESQDATHIDIPDRCYEYVVCLRHYGFPSPLLDWTESPFIALYFAYINALQADDCAVYCYIESTDGVRLPRTPGIRVMGPHVTTDKRHFAQKAWYTLATRWSEKAKAHFFCSHDEVIDNRVDGLDVLFKITLPTSERGNILNTLDDFNINHFTLFHSTDALVRAMASREFDIGEHCIECKHLRLISAADSPMLAEDDRA